MGHRPESARVLIGDKKFPVSDDVIEQLTIGHLVKYAFDVLLAGKNIDAAGIFFHRFIGQQRYNGHKKSPIKIDDITAMFTAESRSNQTKDLILVLWMWLRASEK